MSIGKSGRIVIEIDPSLKRELHGALANDGKSLKDWFVESALAYLDAKNSSVTNLHSSRLNAQVSIANDDGASIAAVQK